MIFPGVPENDGNAQGNHGFIRISLGDLRLWRSGGSGVGRVEGRHDFGRLAGNGQLLGHLM
ncbi:MAG: hypothetical protein KKI16_09040, partial [Alphaproteobacteria bacterium]|nr:hypothetical protein [Alphaproteobacteria bacterium]